MCVFSRATAELSNGTLPTGGHCVKEQMVHCLKMTTCVNSCNERTQCKSILTTHHSTHTDMITCSQVPLTEMEALMTEMEVHTCPIFLGFTEPNSSVYTIVQTFGVGKICSCFNVSYAHGCIYLIKNIGLVKALLI